MALPLDGIRVVEMCQVFAGPFASMLLADQGADVVKIESLIGDSTRGGSALADNLASSYGLSLTFMAFNRNKRAMLLDIHKPKGRELAYNLFRRADVLIVSTRLATRGRWGFAYEDVVKINPKIIYASVTAFGEKGPDADMPGYDIAIQARVGDLALRRPANGPPPSVQRVWHFDMTTGMLTAYAIMLALWERERTGRGQQVATSILQSAIACQAPNMARLPDYPEATRTLYPFPIFQCGDGRYIFPYMAGDPRWQGVCKTLGLEQLIADPRFDTPEKRQLHESELNEILSRRFLARPAAEWEAMLKKNGNVASVANELSEVYDDPQVVANQMMTRFEQPGVGVVEAVNVPFGMSAATGEPVIRRPAPTPGENTYEILEELGYTPEECQALEAEGAIA